MGCLLQHSSLCFRMLKRVHSTSQHHYNPEVHLSLSNITLDRRSFSIMVCVHIKQSKTDPFGRVLTFIRAELTSRFAQSRQLYSTLQCLPCSAVKQARAFIHPLQWQDACHGHNWNFSTTI